MAPLAGVATLHWIARVDVNKLHKIMTRASRRKKRALDKTNRKKFKFFNGDLGFLCLHWLIYPYAPCREWHRVSVSFFVCDSCYQWCTVETAWWKQKNKEKTLRKKWKFSRNTSTETNVTAAWRQASVNKGSTFLAETGPRDKRWISHYHYH